MAHHGVDIAIPAGITDTLKGYITGLNWLVRVVAPDVVLGWQLNLWSVGGSQWVYNDFTYDDIFDPKELFSRHEWDFSEPKYADFPSRGIFHVQVGGGATTGVVSAVNRNSSSWMRAKLKAYRCNPVKFTK